MSQPIYETVALIGIGLIGSSISHAARRKGLCRRLVGHAKSEATRNTALRLGLIETAYPTAAEAVKEAGEKKADEVEKKKTTWSAAEARLFAEQVREAEYRVRRGDTLHSVARRWRVPVSSTWCSGKTATASSARPTTTPVGA